MFFNQATNTDASRSTFNDVGRDLNQINNPTVVLNLFPLSFSWRSGHQPSLDAVCDDPQVANPDALSQRKALVQTPLAETGLSAVDTAARLIVGIVQLLMDGGCSEHFGDLKRELELLQKTLALTGLAIQAYQSTLLGANLANTINTEVQRCTVVLEKLFYVIDQYRQGLKSTPINYFWPKVLQCGASVDELASIRSELSACQKSLNQWLMSLSL